MPAGAGKSICYQVPAIVSGGLTLVISLISLMKDQVEGLRQNGVRASFLNSALSPDERRHVLGQTAKGEVTLLYVAPERLGTIELKRLCGKCHPAIVAVDEAHCASHWGHDFRPDYMKIGEFVESLPQRPVLCAFTATATRDVRADIQRILGLRDPLVVVADFDRPNLHFAVERVGGNRTKKALLRSFLSDHRGQSGIVYCMTRKSVGDVCDQLLEWGYPATRYHGGLSDAERRSNQDDFVYDRSPIMVATSAFGMGIDKSNVGSSCTTASRSTSKATTRKPGARAAMAHPPIACCSIRPPMCTRRSF